MEILQGEIAVSNSIYAKYDSAGYKQHGRIWACLSETTYNGEGLTYQARSRGERGGGGGGCSSKTKIPFLTQQKKRGGKEITRAGKREPTVL